MTGLSDMLGGVYGDGAGSDGRDVDRYAAPRFEIGVAPDATLADWSLDDEDDVADDNSHDDVAPADPDADRHEDIAPADPDIADPTLTDLVLPVADPVTPDPGTPDPGAAQTLPPGPGDPVTPDPVTPDPATPAPGAAETTSEPGPAPGETAVLEVVPAGVGADADDAPPAPLPSWAVDGDASAGTATDTDSEEGLGWSDEDDTGHPSVWVRADDDILPTRRSRRRSR